MRRILLSCLLCIGLALPGAAMSDAHGDNASVSVYGRLWPKVTYTSPSEGDPKTDITDAISRLGVSADYKLSDTLTAIALAEVRVNLDRDGDGRKPQGQLSKSPEGEYSLTGGGDYFLTENLGYVGLQSDNLGLFAIGTQWNPYYNIVAAVTDVYYHAASPFGYDNEGPFREEQLVRYALSFSGLNLDLGVQLKGQGGGDEDYDRVYAGVGYSYGPVYVGLGYLGDATSMEQRDLFGIGASWNVTDDLYLGLTYQSIRHDDPKPNGETLDVAASYSFDGGYTLTGGFFTWDPNTDTSDPDHLGYNLTLIKSLNDNVRVFAEWLRYDFQEDSGSPGETVDHLSLGLRIAFNAKVL